LAHGIQNHRNFGPGEVPLFFVYGPGGNGKSVFVSTISRILADYATTAMMETFVAARGERHPTELASLRGARLVTASETEEGRRWAESRIKALTGGEAISARFMRQDAFEFTPQLKLLISGNHAPNLVNVDEAMRRRLHVIPFTNTPLKPDKELESKLEVEWPGILRWMIEGAVDWQQNGLVKPEIVVAATEDYFTEQNVFAHWLDQNCRVEPNNSHLFSSSRELYESWKAFAESNGEFAGSSKGLASKLARAGLRSETRNVGKKVRGWVGIAVVTVNTAEFADF
jgi:putative DNA primase/helicase